MTEETPISKLAALTPAIIRAEHEYEMAAFAEAEVKLREKLGLPPREESDG